MKLIAVANTQGQYVDLPTPSEYVATPNEDSKAQRNVMRNLYKRRLAVKRTINLSWKVVTPTEKDLILSLTSGNSFQCRYFDPQDGWKYGKFYRGNDIQVKPLVRWNGSEFTAYSITMTLGEF